MRIKLESYLVFLRIKLESYLVFLRIIDKENFIDVKRQNGVTT